MLPGPPSRAGSRRWYHRGLHADRQRVPRVSELVPGCAVVTGGGSGLGRGIATALAKAGAPVAVVDLLPEGGKETVAAITSARGRATLVQADARRWGDPGAALRRARRQARPPRPPATRAALL